LVSYKGRLFKAKLDSNLLTILVDLKTTLERAKTGTTNLTNFIASYPDLFTEVYTESERDEIKDLISTLTTLIDTAIASLPEFIQP